MSKFHYFAYGSNMLHRRLQARTPSAVFQAVVSLPAHKLIFNKVSFKDGSGKCGIIETGNDSDTVHGVLFTIDEAERDLLDKAEGLGKGYDHKKVLVNAPNNQEVEALTYFPANIQDGLLPFDWYKALVLEGARENNLPADYIAAIESEPSKPDADKERAAMNMQLLIS